MGRVKRRAQRLVEVVVEGVFCASIFVVAFASYMQFHALRRWHPALCWAVSVIVCALLVTGCFEWSEDQQGNLRSVGVPGLNLWESSKPSAPLNPTEMGFTSEQAAQFGGPVLVIPPAVGSGPTQYRYYQAGQNHCQEDLEKQLAARGQSAGAAGAPYCTDKPAAPETHGSGFIL